MPYHATIFNVLIASPSDVKDERAIIREVIQDWNAAQPRFSPILLQGIGWDTHSYPSMDGAPQDVLNEQIVDDADLVIALFWGRVGTPTATAPGGAVEELRRHIKAGKPAMVYFSSAPMRPKDFNEAQMRALEEFKAECRPTGLLHEYDSETDFRKQFVRHLASIVNNNPYFTKHGRPGQGALPVHSLSMIAGKLSEDAKTLLLEATNDDKGIIISHTSSSGEFHVNTNGTNLVKDQNPRSRAKWKAALEDLQRRTFIAAEKARGLYRVTEAGYKYAEVIRSQ